MPRVLASLAIALLASPLAGQGPTIRFDGEIRFRGEWDNRTAAANADAATLSRIRLGGRIAADARLRGYVQLQDSRAWGGATNTLTDASADQLDLHQGWLEFGAADDGLQIRLGRQEFALADERLIGSVGWTNTGRVFDGALARYRTGGTHLGAFWMNVAERDALNATGVDPQANQGARDDGWFAGGFVSAPVGAFTVDGALLHDRKGLTDASWTATARLSGRSAGFRIDATGAYQFGEARRAFLASGALAYGVAQGWVGGQVDYLSGDDSPGVGTRKAFHTLYATNHKFYGYMDYLLTPGQLGEAGLIDAMVRVQMPLAGWQWKLDGHRFATPQPLGGSNGFGSEIDLVTTYTMASGALLEVGAAAFRASDGAAVALPAFATGAAGDWTTWAYAQVTLRWR